MRCFGLSLCAASMLAAGALAFEPGQRVLVDWQLRGHDYAGRVSRSHGDLVSIDYDDRSTETTAAANVHAFDWKVGDRIQALWKADQTWYAADIVSLADPDLEVRYEDGTLEKTVLLYCRKPAGPKAAPAPPAAVPPLGSEPPAPLPPSEPALATTSGLHDSSPGLAPGGAAPGIPAPGAGSPGFSIPAGGNPEAMLIDGFFAGLEATIRTDSKDAFIALVHPEGLSANLVGGSGMPAGAVFKQGTREKWYLKPDSSKAEKKGEGAWLVPCAVWSWERSKSLDEVTALVVMHEGRWLFLGAGEKPEQVAALAARWLAKEPLAPAGGK